MKRELLMRPIDALRGVCGHKPRVDFCRRHDIAAGSGSLPESVFGLLVSGDWRSNPPAAFGFASSGFLPVGALELLAFGGSDPRVGFCRCHEIVASELSFSPVVALGPLVLV